MLIHPAEMKKEVREKMRGGEGRIIITHLADPGRLKNARLFASLIIPPGSGIGTHEHAGETEYFYILKGSGSVLDNGVLKEVQPGDVMITGNGDTHSITNAGTADLELLAIIITN
jgi:mannose-6-phosphate isomerase-like protein (cupin superfamily)